MTEKTMAAVADKALDKTDALITKVADISGNMFEAASNLVTKGIDQYGSQAIDAVLWVVRFDGIQNLIYGLIYCIICGFLLFKIHWSKTTNIYDTNKRMDPVNYGLPIAFGWVVTILISLVLWNAGIKPVTNVWNWAMVVKPEIYLVKKTIDLIEEKVSK